MEEERLFSQSLDCHDILHYSVRSTPRIVRHNFKSIEALLSPTTDHTECSVLDKTGYQSHLLSTSLESDEVDLRKTDESSTRDSVSCSGRCSSIDLFLSCRRNRRRRKRTGPPSAMGNVSLSTDSTSPIVTLIRANWKICLACSAWRRKWFASGFKTNDPERRTVGSRRMFHTERPRAFLSLSNRINVPSALLRWNETSDSLFHRFISSWFTHLATVE